MNDTISRQEFLKTTALASAAMLVSSLESWAINTPQKKLRVGLMVAAVLADVICRTCNHLH